MVKDQKTQAHSYTIGALLLQAVVLFGFAALDYIDSLSTAYPPLFGVILGVLGAIAIWLAGEHNENYVRISRLKLWAIICIVLSLIPLTFFFGLFILYHSIISMVGLFETLFFFFPSILVYLFVRKEITQN